MEYRLTRKSVRKALPCYSEYKIRRTVPAGGASIEEVVNAVHIPLKDRLWALHNAVGAPDNILFAHVCWMARRASKDSEWQKFVDKVEKAGYNKCQYVGEYYPTNTPLRYIKLYLVDLVYGSDFRSCIYSISEELVYLKSKNEPREIRAQIKDITKRLLKDQ